jgi:formamidopyrimidine-DNA glycosylase
VPELPDIEMYVEALRERVVGRELITTKLFSPFALRTAVPPISETHGRRVEGVSRMGKRIVLGFDGDLAIVIHLMIAGRLLWLEEATGKRPSGKMGLAAFQFTTGSLALTEAGTKRRAGIYVLRGEAALREHDPGGIEPLTATFEEFCQSLNAKNRTLKRALTNPASFSGIGNAYSDEILHASRLSPVRLTNSLGADEQLRLFQAMQSTLTKWIERLREDYGGKFPGQGKVTAFREGFAVHGRFGKPCPDCELPVQRIRYAENETNYCAKCQNEGRMLADRGLSRLLKSDWPKTIEEMSGG